MFLACRAHARSSLQNWLKRFGCRFRFTSTILTSLRQERLLNAHINSEKLWKIDENTYNVYDNMLKYMEHGQKLAQTHGRSQGRGPRLVRRHGLEKDLLDAMPLSGAHCGVLASYLALIT